MPETSVPDPRKAPIDIDRQVLDILLPHRTVEHEVLQQVATLEQARSAIQRLPVDAEAAALEKRG